MTPDREHTRWKSIIDKTNNKENLSLYDWVYLGCVIYYEPVKMTMIIFILTAAMAFFLQGIFSNPFILIAVSFCIAFFITLCIFTPTIILILLLAVPIVFLIGLIVMIAVFILGYAGVI